jgi:DNA-binding NtrC family response regulator
MHVLVVDDEDGLRMTMAANLELEGFVVTEAENGLKAVELAATTAFDLVLSDMRMPEMNGLGLVRRLKSMHPETPVVLMTGFENEETIRDAVSEGVFTVLTKPCAVGAVVQTVRRALQQHTVLVIDDSTADAQSTVDALAAAGVRSRAVYDAASALEAIEGGSVDVCVVDLVMPEVSGAELVERVRQLRPEIALIAVSGYAVPEMIQKVATDGAYACMHKPFDARELMQVIVQARGPQ